MPLLIVFTSLLCVTSRVASWYDSGRGPTERIDRNDSAHHTGEVDPWAATGERSEEATKDREHHQGHQDEQEDGELCLVDLGATIYKKILIRNLLDW